MAFTFFFRDIQILELIIKHAVPNLVGRSRIRVWDAGCAMGQETYSLAIMLAQGMGPFAFKNIQICASDIEENNGFGDTVRSGIYQEEELKRIPQELLERYFTRMEGNGHFQAHSILRDRISYQRHDLLSLTSIGENFSVILCKNVLLHFQPEERIQVIRMFHKAMAPDGYLATEQTQKMPDEIAHLFIKAAPDGQIFRKAGE
jgi:chemotaxis protein methyltransferase CheR